MSSKLQLTTLAVLVSAALPAQAALYKVVEVTPGVSGTEYYGTAIQPSPIADNGTNNLGCFETTATAIKCEGYKLAGETRNRPEGFSYREEVPFAMNNSFYYVEDNNYDGFEDYCLAQLGYSTCEYWANTQYYSGWNVEKISNSQNSIAFVTNGGTIPSVSGAINTVVNALTENGVAVGNSSTSTQRNIAFSETAVPDNQTEPQSRSWFNDGQYTVGSVSTLNGVSSRYHYKSQAAIWDGDTLIRVPYAAGSNISDTDYYIQSSLRSFYIDGSDFYGVGYNSYTSDNHMNATIFKGSTTKLNELNSTAVIGAEVDYGEDNRHSNSVLTDVNQNLLAVGSAKLAVSGSGAQANRLFVVPNISVDSKAIFFSSDIFFNSAGGQTGGINNFNEIVGRVDVENHREYDGKQRRQRAFIYPYGTVAQGSVQARKDIFNNRAWIIDDLTNDGKVSGTTDNNNQFRIYDASDINDAGVISATALKCAGGYDSVARDSYCGNGSTDETVVAVKLVPIAGADASAIQARPFENSTIERQGGSLGFGAMTLLGLFGFMRKRNK